MEGDLTREGEYTVQHTNDVLQHWTPETCIIVLISGTTINSINKNRSVRTD